MFGNAIFAKQTASRPPSRILHGANSQHSSRKWCTKRTFAVLDRKSQLFSTQLSHEVHFRSPSSNNVHQPSRGLVGNSCLSRTFRGSCPHIAEQQAGKLPSTGPESFKASTSCFLRGVAFAATYSCCNPQAALRPTSVRKHCRQIHMVHHDIVLLGNHPDTKLLREKLPLANSIAKLSRRATLRQKGLPLHT